MPFRDRREAGRRLAEALLHLRDKSPVVLGLPRGGVPVAFEVAQALDAPLDVLIVRKLGVPHQPELGMGAVGEDGVRVLNPEVIRGSGVTDEDIAQVEARECIAVEQRARLFRGARHGVSLAGRTAIIVDDGLATGGTARAAIQVARVHGADRVVLAVPVAPPDTVDALGSDADEVVCLESPEPFWAIGAWYGDFSPTVEREVIELLHEARKARAAAAGGSDPSTHAGYDGDVEVHAAEHVLPGNLTIPPGASGVVVFAHGSGSSRHSPRNRYVADALHRGGLGTLLFDLLSPEEEVDRENVFDIPLLAGRLAAATDWLRAQSVARELAAGYFGASTGAGAALWAAAEPESPVQAVVSRGGRPDLARRRLRDVRSPTLLIVGGRDDLVIDLNREAADHLRCEHRLEIVPGATHLFEEPGTLEVVAELACRWFVDHLERDHTPDDGSFDPGPAPPAHAP
jgi:putative phosphoribosyl transferase